MKKAIILLFLCLLLFLLALAVPTVYFYEGRYKVTPTTKPGAEGMWLPATPPAPFTEIPEEKVGTLVIDNAHGNDFTVKELSLFIQRFLSRGYAIEYLDSEGKEKVSPARLEEKLRPADAFAVFLPQSSFTAEEIEIVKSFVDKGGKLLLVADPTRPSRINSLANQLGITFQSDYLYNLKENDSNFRNIFIKEFKQSDLTRGLRRIALYSASSISPSNWGLAFTDENTFSNLIELTQRFSPMLISQDNRVLAVSDFTFMKEPFNTTYDNNRLLSNIVDWLTLSQRKFLLTDFPHVFRSKVRIELTDTKFLDLGLRLKNLLEEEGKYAEITKFEGKGGDRVFLGLFPDVGKVETELKAGGILLKTDKEISIEITGIGQVYKPDTALLYFHSKEKEKSLILLADAEDGLKQLIASLERGDFRGRLIRDDIALFYREPKPEEKKKP